MTCSSTIQEALELKKEYNRIRITEDILHYVENAKTHKDMVSPISVYCNKNADIFIFDSGTLCVFAIDQSIVPKMHVIGKYNQPDMRAYKRDNCKVIAKDLKLSGDVTDAIMSDENFFISDKGRGEVIIVNSCHFAKNAMKCRLSILEIAEVISMTHCQNKLLVLKHDGQLQVVMYKTNLNKKDNTLYINVVNLRSINLTHSAQMLFEISYSKEMFGSLSMENEVYFTKMLEGTQDIQESLTTLFSSGRPYCDGETMHTTNSICIISHSVDLSKKTPIGSSKKVVTKISPSIFTLFGKVFTVVGKMMVS